MTTFADTTGNTLDTLADPRVESFDPTTLDALPPPARRLLSAAIPPDTPLRRVAHLEMDGEIKLAGRWLPFTACQILHAGVGFVWAPTVGGRLLRFTGADTLGPLGARVEFRLHGRIPVARSSGPDTQHSAEGRLVAETVVWLPQALTPQVGARWEPIDNTHATVTLAAAGSDVHVEVAVDNEGQITSVGLKRWNDSTKPPDYAPFGGSVHSTILVDDGVRIAGSGTVGWDWHTPDQAAGEFFRYRITSAHYSPNRLARG